MDVGSLIADLLQRIDDLWIAALVVAFFAIACEAAKPPPLEGEARSIETGWGLYLNILSLITPLLLLLHAFLTGQAIIAILVVIAGATIGASMIGYTIRLLSRDVARTLNSAAPALALIAFAITVFVTWRSIFTFLGLHPTS